MPHYETEIPFIAQLLTTKLFVFVIHKFAMACPFYLFKYDLNIICEIITIPFFSYTINGCSDSLSISFNNIFAG